MLKIRCCLLIGCFAHVFALGNDIKVDSCFEQFALNINRLNSCIISVRASGENRSDDPKLKGKALRYEHDREYRTDGKSAKMKKYTWGTLYQNPEAFIEKDRASFQSMLVTDGKHYNYSKWVYDKTGDLSLEKGLSSEVVATRVEEFLQTPFLGRFGMETERIDKILRNADRINSGKTELVGDSECYVVEASRKGNKYTVYFDPKHGYFPAKVIVEYDGSKGATVYGRKWPSDIKDTMEYSVTAYVEQEGVWVPKEFFLKSVRESRGKFTRTSNTLSLTELVIDPDHEALRSFTTDDIDEGCRVFLHGVEEIKYIWRNGELVPDVDRLALAELENVNNVMVSDGTVPPALISGGLTPYQLLDKYRATQERLKSFIAKAENRIQADGSKGSSMSRSELRTDGARVSFRSSNGESKDAYSSFLWDGESLTEFSRGSGQDTGKVIITQDEEKKTRLLASEYRGAPLLGICPTDLEPVDAIARKAHKLVLRKTKEKIDESDCYVIDADTERGKYTLWIDPNHDYNIARMTVKKDKGDIIYARGRIQSAMTFTLDNVRFERINDIWVPMEADMEQTGPAAEKWHHNRTEFLLNPDHDALKSFVPDDIPDGAEVAIPGKSGKYRWGDGEPQEVK